MHLGNVSSSSGWDTSCLDGCICRKRDWLSTVLCIANSKFPNPEHDVTSGLLLYIRVSDDVATSGSVSYIRVSDDGITGIGYYFIRCQGQLEAANDTRY